MSVQELRKDAPTSARAGRSEDERKQVRQRRVERLERQMWGRVCITIFVLWHLFALTIWLVPNMPQSAIVHAFAPLIRPYMTFTGLMQSWNMFSPNPDNLDVYVEARIAYKDGSTKSWLFPRMATMDYGTRYREERWRKFIEVPTHGDYASVPPAMARYAARVNNTNPANPPVSVQLFKHSRIMPPPGLKTGPYQSETFKDRLAPFVYKVQPGDLR